MTQSMVFQHSDNAVYVSEAYESNDKQRVDIKFACSPGKSSGYVPFDENELRELRKWVTIQIRKMNKK